MVIQFGLLFASFLGRATLGTASAGYSVSGDGNGRRWLRQVRPWDGRAANEAEAVG